MKSTVYISDQPIQDKRVVIIIRSDDLDMKLAQTGYLKPYGHYTLGRSQCLNKKEARVYVSDVQSLLQEQGVSLHRVEIFGEHTPEKILSAFWTKYVEKIRSKAGSTCDPRCLYWSIVNDTAYFWHSTPQITQDYQVVFAKVCLSERSTHSPSLSQKKHRLPDQQAVKQSFDWYERYILCFYGTYWHSFEDAASRKELLYEHQSSLSASTSGSS